MQAPAAAGDPAAALALDVYCYRIRDYVGAYLAVLGRVDAITFTAGVGENSPAVRAAALAGLAALGIVVDPTATQRRRPDHLARPARRRGLRGTHRRGAGDRRPVPRRPLD